MSTLQTQIAKLETLSQKNPTQSAVQQVDTNIQKKQVECRSPPTIACHSPAFSKPFPERYLDI